MTCEDSSGDFTRMLRRSRGQSLSWDAAVPLVYDELRRVARRELGRSRRSILLETTGLVHEAFVKISRRGRARWQDRQHFFASAAATMRHILVDAARHAGCSKRGGDLRAEPLDDKIPLDAADADQILAVHQALLRLRDVDARLCRIIECRFYAGLTMEETAEALAMSDRTLYREWKRAKGWLRYELGAGAATSANDVAD